MTNEMIERVALAITRKLHGPESGNGAVNLTDVARAAIEASDFAELERYIAKLEERIEQLEAELEQLREDENETLIEPDFTLTVQNEGPEPLKVTIVGTDLIR